MEQNFADTSAAEYHSVPQKCSLLRSQDFTLLQLNVVSPTDLCRPDIRILPVTVRTRQCRSVACCTASNESLAVSHSRDSTVSELVSMVL